MFSPAEKHHAVLFRVGQAFDFMQALVARTEPTWFRRKEVLAGRLLAPATPVMQEARQKMIEAATEKDDALLVRLVTDEYWPQELARHVATAFPFTVSRAEAEVLKEVHRVYEAELTTITTIHKTGPKARFAAAITAVTFLATQVPAQLFTRYGWDYATYRIVVFVVLVVTLAWVALIWLGFRAISLRREEAVSKLCSAVLTFCWALDVRAADEKAEPLQ